MLDRVRGYGHWRRDIESAAGGFGEPCARIGNDDGFTHFVSLPENKVLSGSIRSMGDSRGRLLSSHDMTGTIQAADVETAKRNIAPKG
jgi:hypothetical protein